MKKTNMKCITINFLKMAAIALTTNVLAIFIAEIGGEYHSISALFIITIVMCSLATEGYIYGVIASIYGVFAMNFFFMEPYYEFHFTLSGYPLTLFMLIIISVGTSYLLDSYINMKRQHFEIETEKEIEKTKANLLKFLSHDLRTPLTSILSAISLLEENKQIEENTKDILIHDIKINAKWQLQMIEDLLMMCRVINEPENIKIQEEIIDELIETVIKREKRFHPDIEFDVKLYEEVLLVKVNATLIEQVFQNLIENAYYYGGNTRRIEIETKKENDKVKVLVMDRGKGVDKEKQEILFTQELLAKEINREDGFGMGLYLCDKIMKVHGGMIRYKDREGGGACFIVELPFINEEVQNA